MTKPDETRPVPLFPKKPELIELQGDNYQSYNAGQHFGIYRGLNDATSNVRALKLHFEAQFTGLRDGLAAGLDKVAEMFATKASEHQQAGNKVLATLARTKITERAWWKQPKFLGWLGYVVAVAVGAAVASLVARYATAHGW